MNDLKIIQSQNFGNVQADIYSNGNDMFMTINQLAECLEYASKDAIGSLLSRNPYLKNDEFSGTCKLQATDGKSYNTRIFTEDGIYEVTMLSNQPKAKEFRAWIRKVLKALRKGDAVLTSAAELERIKIKAQQDRAKAMLLNAQNRALRTVMSTISDEKLSPIAAEVFGLKALEELTGKNMGQYLPECKKSYSATEIGNMFDVSAAKVGKLANEHGLKTDEFGMTVMDKARHSNKQVTSFRYYENVIPVLSALLGKGIQDNKTA